MAHSGLVKHLLGVSNESIGQGYTTPRSAEEVDKSIAYELHRLERKALGKVVDAAASGDLAAIAWLENRGLVVFGEYTKAN